MKMTAACVLLPVVFGDDSSLFAAVNEEVGDKALAVLVSLPSMSGPGASLGLLVAQLSSWKRTTLACLLGRRQIFIEILAKFKAVVLCLLTSLTCSPK